MTALSLSAFFPFSSNARTSEPTVDDTIPIDDAERRMVGEMIAAGACDSEYGVQMLMSVFPDRF